MEGERERVWIMDAGSWSVWGSQVGSEGVVVKRRVQLTIWLELASVRGRRWKMGSKMG